jgi:hypothetical protein
VNEVARKRLRLHFGNTFVAIVIAQFILANLLAPGDVGRWLRYAIVTLGIFDCGVYLFLYFGPRFRLGADPGISWFGVAMFAIASVICVICGTYVMEALHLP